MPEKKDKRVILIIIIILVSVGIFILLMVLKQCQKGKGKQEERQVELEAPLELMWTRTQMTMNVGEVRNVMWKYNRAGSPKVTCEGNAVQIVETLADGGVKVRGVVPGVDILTLEAEGVQSVCMITVTDDMFTFVIIDGKGGRHEISDVELMVGEVKRIDAVAEPENLLEMNPLHFVMGDSTIAEILDTETKAVTIIGRRKGRTTLAMEWRGRKAEITVTVREPPAAARKIILPFKKQYINVGQELTVTAKLDFEEEGDRLQFKFTKEKGKEVIAITSKGNEVVIRGLADGEQYVQVNHPKAGRAENIIIDVLPLQPPPAPYIDVSESPVLLRKDQTKQIKMEVVYGSARDNNNFSYRIIENEYAIAVSQKGNILTITGIKPGAAKMVISNSGMRQEYQLMAVVDSPVFD